MLSYTTDYADQRFTPAIKSLRGTIDNGRQSGISVRNTKVPMKSIYVGAAASTKSTFVKQLPKLLGLLVCHVCDTKEGGDKMFALTAVSGP